MLLNKNILAIGIVFLFVCSAFIPMSLGINTRITNTREQPSTFSRGKTLYVGGTGEGNYTKIQYAIDNASDGDTVFVFNGTYYGRIIVNTSISLIGEDKNTTYINGEGSEGITILITSSDVTIREFTLNKCYYDYGLGQAIYIWGNPQLENICISDCIMKNNDKGIFLINVSGFTLSNCHIHHNEMSVWDYGTNSSSVSIHNCIINNNGIHWPDDWVTPGGFYFDRFGKDLDIVIVDCDIFDNKGWGISVTSGKIIDVSHNNIDGNSIIGVDIGGYANIEIHNNTIIKNGRWGISGGICAPINTSNFSICNNNISDNGDGEDIFTPSGIYFQQTMDYIDIKNNLISSNNKYGINAGCPTNIIDNDIIGNVVGIEPFSDHFYGTTIIKDNSIKDNKYGIEAGWADDDIDMIGNTISDNKCGIHLKGSRNWVVSNNVISNNAQGIIISKYGSGNDISNNSFTNNNLGIYTNESFSNKIRFNNFLNNKKDAYIYAYFYNQFPIIGYILNDWYGNYWNKPRLFPKLIFGTIVIERNNRPQITIPVFNLDWFPAQTPNFINQKKVIRNKHINHLNSPEIADGLDYIRLYTEESNRIIDEPIFLRSCRYSINPR